MRTAKAVTRNGGNVNKQGLMRLATVVAALLLTAGGAAAVSGGASAKTPADPTTAAVPGTAYQQIRNLIHDQCVEAPNGAFNIRLKLAACSSDNPTANWVLVPTGVGNTMFIVNMASGFCMTVNGGSSSPFAAVNEFICTGQASQRWVQDGARLRHADTNQCLDTVAGASSELMQFTCGQEAPAGIQSWEIG
jgi:hypothetical protein